MKICFVGETKLTFVKKDLEILKKYYRVDELKIPCKKTDWIKYFFSLFKKIKECEVVFCWFAGWHTFFPVLFSKLFRKKSIIVAGGYDAVDIPELGYGAFSNFKERIPARYVLRNSDVVLAVSKFTKKEILEKVNPKKIVVVYNGIDIDEIDFSLDKENIVITIGSKIKLKGLDTFVKASKYFSNCKFVVVGFEKRGEFSENDSKNLTFLGTLPHDEVLKWLGKAKVYCQLSYVESFGVGVAEAMASGCIPVVTNVGALAELVGNLGFYVEYGEVSKTVDEIKKALESSNEESVKVKKRIVNNFSYDKRCKELISIIDEMVKK
ncbi:MAG: glycosyltransferase [Candidatus Thermoplasmatota archaeon]